MTRVPVMGFGPHGSISKNPTESTVRTFGNDIHYLNALSALWANLDQ